MVVYTSGSGIKMGMAVGRGPWAVGLRLRGSAAGWCRRIGRGPGPPSLQYVDIYIPVGCSAGFRSRLCTGSPEVPTLRPCRIAI